MSTNEPLGQEPSTGPQQNPYDKNVYGPPQPPADPYGQAAAGPAGYGPPPQGPYSQPQGAAYGQQYPQWLSAPNAYGVAPVPGTRQLAGSGDRFLARLIDAAVLLVPFILLYVIVASVSTLLYSVATAAVVLGYEAAMLLTQGGQTLGKKAMKIRVVSLAHGGRPTDAEIWARAGVYAGPQAVYCLGSLFSLLNVLWHLWDKPYQQCLHDKAAKTVVVKES
jgi:uncharacterized RDD family membrane protein YckC